MRMQQLGIGRGQALRRLSQPHALQDHCVKVSPLNPQYLTKKQTVFQKIAAFVEKFKGVGGQV